MKRYFFFAIFFGAALLVVGTVLATGVTRPLSLHDTQILAGGCSCPGYTCLEFNGLGDCDYYTNGPCANNASCSSKTEDGQQTCQDHDEVDHVAGHEQYCDDTNSDHCRAELAPSESQPCAKEYYCYWNQDICKKAVVYDPIDKRKGCMHHTPP